MEDLLQVGAITTTHGVRGEVKVFPTTDDPMRYKKLKTVLVDNGKELLEWEVSGVRFFKNLVIVKFKGIDNINDIQAYKGAKLYVTRDNAVELEEDEYFHADLIGLSVVDEVGEEIGTLKDILSTGANDVYVVARTQGKELMLPAIKDCVRRVDLEKGELVVRLLPGLEDLNG